MKRLGWTIGGAVLLGALAFAVGMALPSIIAISQAEGAYAMTVAFFWTPLGAILGGVMVFFGARRGR